MKIQFEQIYYEAFCAETSTWTNSHFWVELREILNDKSKSSYSSKYLNAKIGYKINCIRITSSMQKNKTETFWVVLRDLFVFSSSFK